MRRKLTLLNSKRTKVVNENEEEIFHIENTNSLFKPQMIEFQQNYKISSYTLSPASLLYPKMDEYCDLLHGSIIKTNNLFGMDISRGSHIEKFEHVSSIINTSIGQTINNIGNSINTDTYFYYTDGVLSYGNKKLCKKNGLKSKVTENKCVFSLVFDTLKVDFNDNINSFYIESDIPIVLVGSKKFPKNLRIVSKSVLFENSFKCVNIEIITDDFNSRVKIDCESLLVRSKRFHSTFECISKSILLTAEDVSFTNIKTENLYITSKNSILLNNVDASICMAMHTKTLNISNSKTPVFLVFCNQLIFKNDVDFSKGFFECKKIINNGIITCTKKITCFALFDESESVCLENKGSITTVDLFYESKSSKPKLDNIALFHNKKELKVTNSFLLSGGTYKNDYHTIIRSLYISENCSFQSDGNLMIGDFLVVENNARFIANCKFSTYATLRPQVFISGLFEATHLFKVQKFVCTGKIQGDLKLESNDVVTLNCNVTIKEIDITAPMVVINSKCRVKAKKVRIKTSSMIGAIDSDDVKVTSD